MATPIITLDQYLNLVLPPNGVGEYFILYKGSSDKHQQKHYPTLSDLSVGIRTLAKQRNDVWVAIGAYGSARTIDQCTAKTCLYADFDCGPTKTYKTKKDILAALHKAVTSGALIEPTLIMDSGNGIHLYWVLDGYCEPGEWRGLAFKLKRAFDLAQLDADTKVTTDLARVLRPPETLNWKDDQNPRPVKALGFKAKNVYSSAHLHLMLPPMEESEMDRATQAKAKTSSATPAQISASIREMDDLIAGATGPLDNLADQDKERVIQQMLDTLSTPRYYDDYNQWVKVGRSLQDAVLLFDDPKAYEVRLFDMWDEWSQQSPSYQPDWKHPQSTSSKWAGEFPKMQAIGVGSLVYLAKQEGFVFGNAKHAVDYPTGYIAADFGTLRAAEDGEEKATVVFDAHMVNGSVSADPHRRRVRLPRRRDSVLPGVERHPRESPHAVRDHDNRHERRSGTEVTTRCGGHQLPEPQSNDGGNVFRESVYGSSHRCSRHRALRYALRLGGANGEVGVLRGRDDLLGRRDRNRVEHSRGGVSRILPTEGTVQAMAADGSGPA